MDQHAEREHKLYSPSQLERLALCPGSNNLIARVKPGRVSSKYAIEGTNAHEVLEAALKNRCETAADAHWNHSSLCCQDMNDMHNQFYYSITVAMNYVYGILDEYPDAIMYLEEFVDPPSSVAPGETGGYLDILIVVPSIRTIFVIDFKHGAGVAKDVEGNPQINQYASGALFQEKPLVDPEHIDHVVLVIVQPRAFHKDGMIRETTLTPYDIGLFTTGLDAVISKASKPDAPLIPGDVQCQFCDVNTVCPAREAKALQVAKSTFSQIEQVNEPSLPAPKSLDIARLGYIRQHAGMLRKWLKDVDDHAFELASQGYDIPGCKMVESEARREYFGSVEETVNKLVALTGSPRSDFVHEKLLPLTQTEKLVVEAFKKSVSRGKKRNAAVQAKKKFAYLTIKKSSGSLSLVPLSDDRPAVNRSQIFNQVGLISPPPTNTGD